MRMGEVLRGSPSTRAKHTGRPVGSTPVCSVDVVLDLMKEAKASVSDDFILDPRVKLVPAFIISNSSSVRRFGSNSWVAHQCLWAVARVRASPVHELGATGAQRSGCS